MERAGQKHVNYLPLVRQFALTAVKLQMFGRKTHHVWHPSVRTCFFVLCPRLDTTHSNVVIFTKGRMPDTFSLLIVCP